MELCVALWMLAAVIIISYLLWFTYISRPFKGPRVWPLVGYTPAVIDNANRIHDWCSEDLSACGGTYQACLSPIPFLRRQGTRTVTCDPKNMEHILKTRFHNYPKGPNWHVPFNDLLGQGIINSDGDIWLRQRKAAAPEFSNQKKVESMARWVNQAIQNRLLPFLEAAQREDQPVDLQDLLVRLSFDNICGIVFGKDPQTLSPGLPRHRFLSAFETATEASVQRMIFPHFLWKLKKRFGLGMEGKLSRSLADLNDYLFGIIDARKFDLRNENRILHEEEEEDDLLSRFMKKDKTCSDTYLRDVSLSFILAGHDTSAVTLSWFFWLLMRNPSVEEKVMKELCAVLIETRGEDRVSTWMIDKNRPPLTLTFKEVDRLVYLKAALSETLRLYPSVPANLKHVVADDVLPDGTFVPAGSEILLSLYSAGRMKSTWGEDCLEFKPERWLSSSLTGPDGSGNLEFVMHDPFKFPAFNAGPRSCLGKNLAYVQMRSVAAAVLLRHKLILEPGHKVEQKISMLSFMKFGLIVNLTPRDLSTIVTSINMGCRNM